MVTLRTLHEMIYFLVLSMALSSPFLHKKQGLMLCPSYAGLLKLAHVTLTLRIWLNFLASVLHSPCFRQHGVLASDQPALQATRQSVHCVLLIVQPLECADDAGFTLVHSHSCTLLSVRLSCSPSYFYTLYFCKFVSYANILGTRPAVVLSGTLMQAVRPNLKPMNKSACM